MTNLITWSCIFWHIWGGGVYDLYNPPLFTFLWRELSCHQSFNDLKPRVLDFCSHVLMALSTVTIIKTQNVWICFGRILLIPKQVRSLNACWVLLLFLTFVYLPHTIWNIQTQDIRFGWTILFECIFHTKFLIANSDIWDAIYKHNLFTPQNVPTMRFSFISSFTGSAYSS